MFSNKSPGQGKDTRMSFFRLITRHKTRALFCAIFIVAVAVRIFQFPSHPGGLNQDEASIGYDAWSLLYYGVDRHGQSFPVHLLAWGSGQNALYAYLSMPFVLLFGLNVFSVRCVNLLFGLISLPAVYFIAKAWRGKACALAAMALTAISPWHIILSRWGLESNLFPAMFLLAAWALVGALQGKPRLLALSAALFGLSLYSYGPAYLVVTLFCAAVFAYILVKKLLPPKICAASATVFLLVSVPIYIFVIVNLFQLGDVTLGPFTIPQVQGSRLTAQTELFSGNAPGNLYNNLVLQYDFTDRNALMPYGCFYLISLPFCLLGIISCARERSRFRFVLLAALLSAVCLFFAFEVTNINRVNAVYFPLIIFTAAGLTELIKNKTALAATALSYLLFFGGFCHAYFRPEYREKISSEFFASFGDALLKAEELSGGNVIHVTNAVNMPYIYVLFYNKIPPEQFYATAVIENIDAEYHHVKSFDRYIFSIDGLRGGEPGVYVTRNGEVGDVEGGEVYTFGDFSVVVR